MKRALAILFLLAAVQAGGQHAPEEELQRVLALEKSWNLALRDKDAGALAPLLSDELLFIGDAGALMNKAQYLASMQSADLFPVQSVIESIDPQMHGQTALVVGVYREKGTRNGKPYEHHGRFVDTWINRGGAWLCVTSQSTLIKR